MVDLKGQYIKIQKEVELAMQGVVSNTTFINGPEVQEFATNLENYLSVANVITCGNGTDALQIALMSLDLQPDDEIICPDFTFVATAEVAELLGLKTVLADVDPSTFMLTEKTIKNVISPKTKVIVPVHLFGQCTNMEPILKLAKEHNLFVIEDTAQAIGAEYTFSNGEKAMAGTMGDIGTSSFFPSKNLGCYGDGGALFTNNNTLAKKCKSIANHGMGERYFYECVGINSRLDTIQAAVLNVKLNYLNEYNAARIRAANYYNKALLDCKYVTTPVQSINSSHVYHQYTLKLAAGINRDELMAYMNKKEIPVKIYYPKPLHSFSPYKQEPNSSLNFEHTEALCSSVFSLPMHTELDEETLKYITDSLRAFFENISSKIS